MHSLRTRLLGLWALSLVASVAVGILLVQLYQQSTAAQAGHARAALSHACDLIQDRYDFYVNDWAGPGSREPDARLRSDLTTVVTFALAREDGIEGGIWQGDAGSLAYAFPTYQGAGPKTDLPAAERQQIQAINERAEAALQPVTQQIDARTETLLLQACPLSGPISNLSAWTMTRVHAAAGLRPLQFAVATLLALALAMSAWLGRILFVWDRHVRGIEAALGQDSEDATLRVPRTGERELDRVIDALNEAGRRLAAARAESLRMAQRVARAERMAGLGRVAAGVAHEIRNPIAAARLQGENALAGDDRRRQQAITDMLGQLDRLDAHVAELLAMTQRVDPAPVPVFLPDFLTGQVARHKETAAAKQLDVSVGAPELSARLDPNIIGRVLDNLLTNAVRHAPPGGQVAVRAECRDRRLVISVADSGSGVLDELQDRLFEPFVTGRPDGTGLGLAIARELADAHDGHLDLLPAGPGSGAVFELSLPRESTTEDPWPAS